MKKKVINVPLFIDQHLFKLLPNAARKPILLSMLLVLFGSAMLVAQPVWKKTTSGSATSGTVVSVAHDLTAVTDANLLMLVGVSTRNRLITVGSAGSETSNVTYDGVPMVYVGSEGSNTDAVTYIFSLLSPPNDNASATVDVTFSSALGGNNGGVVGVMTFSNVDQNNPYGAYTSSPGNTASPSLTISATTTSQLVFDVLTDRAQTITDPTGRTSFWKVSTGGDVQGAGSTKTATASSTTMSWAIAASARWSLSGVAVNAMPIANLGITKTVSNSTPYAGQLITFTLTATNTGPSDALNVTVNDLLPSGYIYESHSAASGTTYNAGTGEWGIGTMANAASKVLTINAYVKASGAYTNNASISGDVIDNTSGNDAASASITVCNAGGAAPIFKQ